MSDFMMKKRKPHSNKSRKQQGESLKLFYRDNPNIKCGFQKGNKIGEGRGTKGRVPWNKGLTKETDKQAMESSVRMKNNNPMRKKEVREKVSKSLKKRWDKIGRKKHKRSIHLTRTKKYKEWRMAVFLRDSFVCQFCNVRGVPLEAHHIKEWAYYPKLRYEVDNGITLCVECHKLTRKFYGNQYKDGGHGRHV